MVIGSGTALSDEGMAETAGGSFGQDPGFIRGPERRKFLAVEASAHADDGVMPGDGVAGQQEEASGGGQVGEVASGFAGNNRFVRFATHRSKWASEPSGK